MLTLNVLHRICSMTHSLVAFNVLYTGWLGCNIQVNLQTFTFSGTFQSPSRHFSLGYGANGLWPLLRRKPSLASAALTSCCGLCELCPTARNVETGSWFTWWKAWAEVLWGGQTVLLSLHISVTKWKSNLKDPVPKHAGRVHILPPTTPAKSTGNELIGS